MRTNSFPVGTALLVFSASAAAGNNSWTNASGNFAWNTADPNWTSPSIWSNNIGTPDAAIFGNQGIGTVTVGSAVANRIVFNANGYTLSGGNISLLDGTGPDALSGEVEVADGVTARIDSNISTTNFAFTKHGPGELILGGTNSFTGTAELFTGQSVNFRIRSRFNAAPGVVRVDSATAINATAAVGLAGGRLELGAFNYTFDRLVIAGGSAIPGVDQGVFGTGTLTLTSNRLNFTSGGTNSVLQMNLQLTGDLALNVGGIFSNAYEGHIGGTISGDHAVNFNTGVNGSGVNAAAGIILSGDNTFTGGFNINNNSSAGVEFRSDSAFGTAVINVNANSRLRAFQTRIVANNIVMNAASLSFDSAAGRGEYTGTIDLNATGGSVTRTLNFLNPFAGPDRGFHVAIAGPIIASNGTAAVVQGDVGAVDVRGQSTFTGGWTISAGGTLEFDANSVSNAGVLVSGPIGTGALTLLNNAKLIAINGSRTIGNGVVVGGNFTFRGIQDLTLSGNVNLNTGATAVTREITVDDRMNATLSGSLFASGAGAAGLTKRGTGVLTLAGDNSGFSGATTVADGVLGFAGNQAFDSGSLTVTNGNTSGARGIRFDTAGNYSKNISFTGGSSSDGASLITNGVDAIYSGTLSAAQVFQKSGAGILTVVNPIAQTDNRTIRILGGGLTLAENGSMLAASTNQNLEIARGETLTLDNTLFNSSNRIADSRQVQLSGNLVLLGNSTANSAETIKTLASGGTFGTLTLVPGAGHSAIFTLNPSAPVFFSGAHFRGTNLGASVDVGEFSRVVIAGQGAGVMSGSTASATATGIGDSWAYYDPSIDSAGAIGVRPMRDSEYTVATTIRNSTGVSPGDHFRVLGNVVAEADLAGVTRINSLTFSGPGSTLTLAPGQTLRPNNIMVQASATDALITGGTLATNSPGTNIINLHVHGNLTLASQTNFLSSVVSTQGFLNKYGNGTLRVANDELFSAGRISFTLYGGRFDLNGTTQSILSLDGDAGTTVDLNGGAITIFGGTYAGSIVGHGAVNGSSLRMTGESTYAGSAQLSARTGFLSSGTFGTTFAENGRWSNVEQVTAGPRAFVTFENSRGYSSAQRLGTETEIKLVSSGINYGGLFNLPGGSAVDVVNDSFGTLTLVGANGIDLPRGGPGVSVSFAALNRVGNATLQVRAPISTYDVGGPSDRYRTRLQFEGGLPIISDPNGPSGGQNTGVVPFLIVGTSDSQGDGGSFATYDGTGVRLMRASDSAFVAQVGSGMNLSQFQNRNVNVNQTTPANVVGSVRVNALRVSQSTINGDVDGNIKIYSGLLSATSATFNSVALDAGANPFYIFGRTNTLNGASDLRGSAGVVVSGTGLAGERVLTFRNNANTFTGGLSLYGAFVDFTSDAQLGASGGGVAMEYGSLVYSLDSTANIAANRTIQLGEGHGAFEVTNVAGTLAVDAKITGVGDLYKTGTGTLILGNAANDYTGTTVLLAGTTRLTAAALPNATRVVLGSQGSGGSSATLDLNGQSVTVSGLRHGYDNNAGVANVVTNQLSGQSATLTLNSTANETFGGTFSGNLRFVKTGAGTFTAAAATAWNQMQGEIEVKGGKLVVNGAGGSGQITVSDSGVLAGSGTIARAVSVANGGVLSPGASPGQLTFTNSLDLSNGGVFHWELGALTTTAFSTVSGGPFPIAGFNFDQIVIGTGGSIQLGGTSKLEIDVSLLDAIGPDGTDPFWDSDHSWTAIDLLNGGVNIGDSKFAQITNATFGRGVFSTSVNAGRVSINFTAAPVPEPSSVALVGLVVVGFFIRRHPLLNSRCN